MGKISNYIAAKKKEYINKLHTIEKTKPENIMSNKETDPFASYGYSSLKNINNYSKIAQTYTDTSYVNVPRTTSTSISGQATWAWGYTLEGKVKAVPVFQRVDGFVIKTFRMVEVHKDSFRVSFKYLDEQEATNPEKIVGLLVTICPVGSFDGINEKFRKTISILMTPNNDYDITDASNIHKVKEKDEVFKSLPKIRKIIMGEIDL